MDVRQIAQDYLVAGQIGPDHVPAIARAGIKAIVCNRPDFEPGAVPHEVVRQAAERAGLEFHYIPVDHQVGITHENIAATVRVITGTRLLGGLMGSSPSWPEACAPTGLK